MTLRYYHNLLLSLAAMTLFASCATYNEQAGTYYSHLQRGEYAKASAALNNNKLLKKKRNRLLYLMEKGKMEHLLGNYAASNVLLNEADQLMEDTRNSLKDVAMGYLMNPMMETYQGEHFENYMLHYYKALNYLQLNEPAEALVEARRITLTANTKSDYAGNRDRYSRDAFSFILQGLIYEKNQALNDAFISYRNAAELFLANDKIFYGIRMPEQLKKDLLRTAYLNGFYDELEKYEQLLEMKFDRNDLAARGELVVFWENGLSPVKTEQNLLFDIVNDGSAGYYFVNNTNGLRIPFHEAANYKAEHVLSLSALKIVLPRYRAQPLFYQNASIRSGTIYSQLEDVQDINELAFATLRERWLQEIGKTLARQAIKRLAELALTPQEKKESDSKEEKKKKDRKEALVTGLKIFNVLTEKADTRNWQSLPGRISYSRIPLQKGTNHIELQVVGHNGQVRTDCFSVLNTGGIQIFNYCTARP